MERLKICTQCTGIDNKIGCFLRGEETGKQYTKTYESNFELFNSLEYKKIKQSHVIF